MNKMNRRALIIYYILSILFVLFIVALAGYRVKTRLEGNLAAASKSFERLKITALSMYLAERSFDSEYFKNRMKQEFRAARPLLLAIYSRPQGILYLLAKNKAALRDLKPEEPLSSGSPAYPLRPFYEVKLSSPFAPGIQSQLYIDGYFAKLDENDFYAILKEVLYLFLAYVLVTGIPLLLSVLGGASPQGKQKAGRGVAVAGIPARTPAAEAALRPQPQTVRSTEEKTEGPAETRSLFSPHTGLGWEDLLQQRLGFELERAASFDQDLALIYVRLDASSGLRSPREVYRRAAELVLNHFPFKDLVFEYGQDGFAVILPDKDLDQALKTTEALKKNVETYDWSGQKVTLSCGLSARNGRLISQERLILEAQRSLQKAVCEGGNQILAFRVDPDKYRQVVLTRKG